VTGRRTPLGHVFISHARGHWALTATAAIGALGLAAATVVGVSALTDGSQPAGSQRHNALHLFISPSHGATSQSGTGSKKRDRAEGHSRPTSLPGSPPTASQADTAPVNPDHPHRRQTPTPNPSSSTYTVTPPPSTYPETVGGTTNTWSDYADAGGTEGATIAADTTVQISCRVQGFAVQDGNPWWYQIATSPWNNSYYASADAFYNNGSVSGSLNDTPYYDPAVPEC
jgi:hypothetical protein